jgi:hypothetical protein
LIPEGRYSFERTELGSFEFRDPRGIVVPISGERRFRGNVHALFATDVAIDAGTTGANGTAMIPTTIMSFG